MNSQNNSDLSSSDPSKKARKPRKPRQPKYPSVLASSSIPIVNQPTKINVAESQSTIEKTAQPVKNNNSETLNNPKKANGIEEGNNNGDDSSNPIYEPIERKSNQQQQQKLGILLIDHGSKRQASNDHLQSLAELYESTLNQIPSDFDKDNSKNIDGGGDSNGNAIHSGDGNEVVVRAAHMEIAEPSILTSLRQLLQDEPVDKILCVPYFLSPGKHATIDVPNLISDAIDVLDKEGLLGMDNGERVEILATKSLGSRLETMLGAVDDLVDWTLYGDADKAGGGIIGGKKRLNDILKSNKDDTGGRSDDKVHASSNNNVIAIEEELRKYTNRYKLLESMLQTKVQQLKKMTNRAKLLEDALTKVQTKSKKDLETNGKQLRDDNNDKTDQIANLTSFVESLVAEKEDLESQTEALVVQQVKIEREYNATITEFRDKINHLEASLAEQFLEKEQRQQNDEDNSNKANIVREEEIKQLKEKIEDLQIQLSTLLDAYNELEQLHNETESTVLQYKHKLKESQEEYQTFIKNEKEKKQKYKLQWSESQQLLEEKSAQSQELLDSSKNQYERSLEEERERTNEWKQKWEILMESQKKAETLGANTTSSIATNTTGRSDEEWIELENELEEATSAMTNATAKAQALELQLHQMQDQEQSKNAQQLENLLNQQAELESFNQTIHSQQIEISKYQEQLQCLEERQQESILIATSSVEASQRRETDLLTNIEELESELEDAVDEKHEMERELADLKDRFVIMEKETKVREEQRQESLVAAANTATSAAVADTATLSELNKQLTMENEQLRYKIEVVTKERERMWVEKNTYMIASLKRDDGRKENEGSIPKKSPESDIGKKMEKKPKKRKWRRSLLKPWTLFGKQRVDDDY